MNTTNHDDVIIDGGYAPENGQEKIPVCIASDVSGSMLAMDPCGKRKIDLLNEGLQQFYNNIASDPVLSQSVKLCLMTFNETVKVVQKYSLVENFTMPTLTAGGGTNLEGAVLKIKEEVEAEKKYLDDHGVSRKRAFNIIFCDGQAFVSDQTEAMVKQDSTGKHYFNQAIGVGEDANMAVLDKVSSEGALRMKDAGQFSAVFRELSNSLGLMANANPDAPASSSNPFAAWTSTSK